MNQPTHRQTLREFVAQWDTILSLPHLTLHSSLPSLVSNDGSDDDPFECQSMEVPPTHVLADAVADEFVGEWRALDQRRITLTSNTSDDRAVATDRASLPRWYERRVRLPENFDYTSMRRADNPPSLDDDTDLDRVLSLDDPSVTTSYHAELWHLFQRIPTATMLDAQATDTSRWSALINPSHGGILDTPTPTHTLPTTTTGTNDHVTVPLAATRALREEMETSHQQSKMADGHALSRLRMNDRHDSIPLSLAAPTDTGTVTAPDSQWMGTVRLELVRQQLRRTSTPEPNRMVLEFLGSQTLLEVHAAIVELTHDDLTTWHERQSHTRGRAASNTRGALTDQPRTTHRTNQADSSTLTRDTAVAPTIASGFFFIEDTFYTAGPVDYTVPIREWLLSGNSDRERKRRCLNLGIATPSHHSALVAPPVRDMNIALDEVSCRLGIRYVHVHQGDVECTVFVTDRRLIPQPASTSMPFPVLHDVWSPSYTVPECDACLARPASVATSTTCTITPGQVAVCETCSRQLELPTKAHSDILPYDLWRGQVDLSAGASNDVAW